jgi:site-specific DNA-methyltransferase (cytosine-N4-specific)
MKKDPRQISLFDVEAAYIQGKDAMSNDSLYEALSERCGVPRKSFDETQPIGNDKAPASPLKRQVRWHQQTLKHAGILEKTDQRGYWRLQKSKNVELHENIGKTSLVAFSTDLGVAIWGRCEQVFRNFDAPITLCITSPPYPLKNPRAYGNPTEKDYVDFICRSLEPIVANLSKDGSICLNLSNDIFEHKSPARSLYKERLVIALYERLGLHKMDEIVWVNPCKPPGPIQWASKTRQQLNVGWEPILWFSPDPINCKSNNNRVLEPHSEAHLQFLSSSHRPDATYSDGAYRRRKTSFRATAGKIPRNVIKQPHNCIDQSKYKRIAKEKGLPAHGAPYPLALAKFFIEFMTEPDDLVVDMFGGSLTSGVGSEELGRRWVVVENMLEYLIGGSYRFQGIPSFYMNNQLMKV